MCATGVRTSAIVPRTGVIDGKTFAIVVKIASMLGIMVANGIASKIVGIGAKTFAIDVKTFAIDARIFGIDARIGATGVDK